jgi:hypothetical protein
VSWVESHKESERLASAARIAAQKGDREDAITFYRQAAEAERQALLVVDVSKALTLGITAISAASLWYKARDFKRAEHLAHQWLAKDLLPEVAVAQLKDLVQTMWGETALEQAGVRFIGDEVLVSVKGGQVVTGGAPLDLVLLKVDQVSRLFLRTVEWMVHAPHRKRSAKSRD